MFKRFLLVALALGLPAVAAAQVIFRPRELIVIPVRPIDATHFEVIEDRGAGGAQLWCAASLFSRDVLNRRRGDLTVQRARGPSEVYPGRKSVIFTTQPVEGAFSSTSTGVRRARQRFSIGHANALCRSNPEQLIKVRVLAQ